ncbi:MAG TPA: D-alanine--D-alanine ligase [Candidatus Saccharimonadales bacterium]
MHKDTRAKHKMRVGVLFGGKSAEHEVSIQSAKNVTQAMDKERFEPVLIGIDKSGQWHLADSMASPFDGANVVLLPGNSRRELIAIQTGEPIAVDVVFPVLHGTMGEDGSAQGLLELANMPYVGAGILGSAIGMDKDVMKRLLRDAHIDVTDFISMSLAERAPFDEAGVIERLGLPLFVKPANMGSSVGVSKVSKKEDLQAAIDEAFRFDAKILLEKAVVGDEIECAVLGNDAPEASLIGRIVPRSADFYSYKAKYVDDDGAYLEIPAKITDDVAERAHLVAVEAFKVLACAGMARVDMFACQDGKILVNEINTIPGFTKISMYPKLWEASGLTYIDLITRLIELAIARFNERQKLATSYEHHL